MAKIDVTKIDGYAEMSAEDKIKALESYVIDDGTETINKLKESLNNASSQAAEWKKKHNALLDEDARKKQEQEETFAQMQKELDSLKKEKTIASYTAKYTALGYDEQLAKETAEAIASGDIDKVIANQGKYTQSLETKIKADILKGTDKPPAGKVGNETITKEQFDKMSYAEKTKLYESDKELYDKLNK